MKKYKTFLLSILKEDITENHNGDIKVFGWWHSKDNVMFYDIIYNDRKKKIEAKYKRKELKNAQKKC